uniref:Mitogen-activated protein kinase 15 n=1 Tax=Leptobrachium leishanense TaxID=445787 RepID=A0A8C5PRJ8_9ANUR
MSVPEVEDHISQKYDIKKRLGKGAYGIVWKAIDRKTGEIVAVKKIFDAFRNRTDAQPHFSDLLFIVIFLQEFGEHPNIIKLLNVIRAQNDKDIYLVFEYMETDLHAVIKKGNLLKDIHMRYILYQLLKATKFIHSGNVIHRDQKPSNILLDADCLVKLCDFGLARSLYQIQEDSGNPALTEYVATRWYRAPEILLASHRYTKGVDMWSVGCILGEMLLGKPLFPGTSTINQIERIMNVIPSPTQEDILAIKSEFVIHIIPQNPCELLPASCPPEALDLLHRLLVFNPDKRLTADEALQHPYVKRFHSPLREPALDYDVILPLDDDVQLSVRSSRPPASQRKILSSPPSTPRYLFLLASAPLPPRRSPHRSLSPPRRSLAALSLSSAPLLTALSLPPRRSLSPSAPLSLSLGAALSLPPRRSLSPSAPLSHRHSLSLRAALSLPPRRSLTASLSPAPLSLSLRAALSPLSPPSPRRSLSPPRRALSPLSLSLRAALFLSPPRRSLSPSAPLSLSLRAAPLSPSAPLSLLPPRRSHSTGRSLPPRRSSLSPSAPLSLSLRAALSPLSLSRAALSPASLSPSAPLSPSALSLPPRAALSPLSHRSLFSLRAA